MTAVLTLIAGCLGVVAVIGGRALAANQPRQAWTAYRLYLPAKLTANEVFRLLTIIGAGTEPTGWLPRARTVVGLEVVATAEGMIRHYLVAPIEARDLLVAAVRGGLPGARIEE